MPYVKRNKEGEITGYAKSSISDTLYEFISEDDPDLKAYLVAREIPEALTKPLTAEDLARLSQEQTALEKEHADLSNLQLATYRTWVEMEQSLCALLYVILNIQPRSSHIAYAIYFAVTSLEARTDIVHHALTQLISENKGKLRDVEAAWTFVRDSLRGPRTIRNKVAHGAPLTLAIRNKKYARFCPPPFDQVRVGRKIQEGQIPGLTTSEIRRSLKTVNQMINLTDAINRVVDEFHEQHESALRHRLGELKAHLQALQSRSQVPRNPKERDNPPPPSRG